MATGNMNNHEIGEPSTNQTSCLISASCRIQDFPGIYINPEETISVDAESTHLIKDLNSDTPNKYPNAPHSSPIDLQNDPNGSVFNAELVKCLNALPVIYLSLEERTNDDSTEMSEFEVEVPPRSYLGASVSDVTSNGFKEFQYHESADKNCSVKVMTVPPFDHLASGSKSKSTEPYSTTVNNHLEKFNFLSIDSIGDFNTEFCRGGFLGDDTSIIANCASEASDLSLEDVESVSSDDISSYASRDRIEFEALALDSTTHSSVLRSFQHWRTRGRNRRALSLDEMSPSKILHTADFSATPFELNI